MSLKAELQWDTIKQEIKDDGEGENIFPESTEYPLYYNGEHVSSKQESHIYVKQDDFKEESLMNDISSHKPSECNGEGQDDFKENSLMNDVSSHEPSECIGEGQDDTPKQCDESSIHDDASIKQYTFLDDLSKSDHFVCIKEELNSLDDPIKDQDICLPFDTCIKQEPLLDDYQNMDPENACNIAPIQSSDCELSPSLEGCTENNKDLHANLNHNDYHRRNDFYGSNTVKYEQNENGKSSADMVAGDDGCIEVEDCMLEYGKDTSNIKQEIGAGPQHDFSEGTHQKPSLIELAQSDSETPITEKTPTECKICNKSFKDLKSHKLYKHSGGKVRRFTCKSCPKSFLYLNKLELHQRIHTGLRLFKCKYCEKEFTHKGTLYWHEMIHTGTKQYKCTICSKQFRKSEALKVHMRIHTGEKPYKCKLCGMRFRTIGALRSHEMRHTSEKMFKCDDCLKLFMTPYELRRHQSIHSRVKPHKCQYCDKYFTTLLTLKQHKMIHTGEKPYKCKFCGKSFRQSSALKVHVRVHTGERPYKCNLCLECFGTSGILKKHRLIHTEKQFKCKYCDKSFREKHGLARHELSHLRCLRPFECTICLKKFTTSHNLRRHIITHANDETFICKFCERSFASSANLEMHVMIHTGETPFICKQCEIGFKSRVELKKHDMIHSMKNQFVKQKDSSSKTSKFLEMIASNSSALEVSKVSEEKTYKCKTCDKSFARPFDMRIHERVHT
ncbi:unnamed protein product [Owenia fusiformis]|uniref:Uncharacterized protein n=1 Tax=Owenia fusiformis TaxID=6347 RepID=A0A8J1XSY3_OWEFU|nr:unnamed protein product [Owenia fusiformis]